MVGHTSPQRRLLAPIGVALAGAIIVWATLSPTPGSTSPGSFMCLTCGAWVQDGLDNILLFAPLGFSLAALTLGPGRPTVVALLLSLGIELLQVKVIAGRDAALHDVIANGCGGALGELTWRLHLWWPRPRVAAWAASVGTVLLGLAAGAPGRWFVPQRPPVPYFAHLNPRVAPFPADASLLAATWNGRAIGCCPDTMSARMQSEAARGVFRVDVTAVLHAVPSRRGRLLTVWDARSMPVVAIGVSSTKAWALAPSAALAEGVRDFAVGVSPPRPWQVGDTVRMHLEASPGAWHLAVALDAQEATADITQRPLLASYYFLPGFFDVSEPHAVMRWMVFLLPAAFLGWGAGFIPSLARWLAGPIAAGIAGWSGSPWTEHDLVFRDLSSLVCMVWVTTAIALVAQQRQGGS